MTGAEVDDPDLAALVGELAVRSPDFAPLWNRHDVKLRGSGLRRMRQPRVGDLELAYEKLGVQGIDGQTLIVFHALPGTPSEDGLQLLATLLASDVRTADHESEQTKD